MGKRKHKHVKNSRKNLPAFKESAGELRDLVPDGADASEFEKALSPLIHDMVGLVQIATLGEVARVKDLIKHPGDFLEKIMKEDQGRLLAYLQVRGFYEIATRESNKDPLEWAKFQLEVTKYLDLKAAGGGYGAGGNGRPASPSGEVAVFSNELLREVAPDSEETGSGGS